MASSRLHTAGAAVTMTSRPASAAVPSTAGVCEAKCFVMRACRWAWTDELTLGLRVTFVATVEPPGCRRRNTLAPEVPDLIVRSRRLPACRPASWRLMRVLFYAVVAAGLRDRSALRRSCV